MEIQFYNTLCKGLEPFIPVEKDVVRMYSCGPTVYDYAHIGNFRSFLFADLLRRFLEVSGFQVSHVMNITDVGHMTEDQQADGAGHDKMQVAAERLKEAKKSGKVKDGAVEDPNDPYQVAKYYTDAFLEDAKLLGLKVASEYPEKMPHATNTIKEMQQMIQTLLDKGHAYVANDNAVYFDTASFPAYGALSGNTLSELRSGAGGRVTGENQAAKKHPADFLLWKADSSHLMKWDSPWGEGYPGWHLECSVMALNALGAEVIDIHTGGEDLIFPHHECEIAQSCCTTGQNSFARFWLHARFLLVDGKKMSKRDGTFYTVRDILEGKVTEREMDPAVLRYELIKTHYRSNLNFTAKGLLDSAQAVRKIREKVEQLSKDGGAIQDSIDCSHPVMSSFTDALADDLNISEAMGGIFAWLSKPGNPSEALAVLKQLNKVLAIIPETAFGESSGDTSAFVTPEVKAWQEELDAARAAKDYAKADSLRDDIRNAGFEVRITPKGTEIRKILA